MNAKSKIATINITKTALSAAIICVLGPLSLSLPVSPVPISLGILGIFFSVYVNGWLWGTISVLIYLLIGFVGVPVFANFTSGAGKLLGPTGGYMIGYLLISLIAGYFIEKFENKILLHIIGMILGTAACYFLGTTWLMISLKMSFTAALMAGVIPFIPADVIKMAIAVAVGIPIRKGVGSLGK